MQPAQTRIPDTSVRPPTPEDLNRRLITETVNQNPLNPINPKPLNPKALNPKPLNCA